MLIGLTGAVAATLWCYRRYNSLDLDPETAWDDCDRTHAIALVSSAASVATTAALTFMVLVSGLVSSLLTTMHAPHIYVGSCAAVAVVVLAVEATIFAARRSRSASPSLWSLGSRASGSDLWAPRRA